MASFVQQKANTQWMWLAMDVKTRQIIACHVGDRSRKSAKKLWAKIPVVYRQQATFYTNQYVVYEGVIPAARHRAIAKKKRAQPITSSGSTIRYDRVCRVWCAVHCRF